MRFLYLFLLIVFSISNVHAAQITRSDAQEAIAAQLRAHGVQIEVKVFEVVGCLPAFKLKNSWSCVLDYEHPKTKERVTKTHNFRLENDEWIVNPDIEYTAACAPMYVVEAAFRKARNDTALKVVGVQDDGEGSFTDERGITRDKKGPLRLMCSYDVKTGAGAELSFITYVWHDGQNYIVDPDWEIWD